MRLLCGMCLTVLLGCCPALAGDDGHPLSLWRVDGARNSVFLLVVTLCKLGQMKFDAMYRIEPDAHEHHHFNIDRGVPGFGFIK